MTEYHLGVSVRKYSDDQRHEPTSHVVRMPDSEQTIKVLAALNDNRKSLGWVPQSMKQY